MKDLLYNIVILQLGDLRPLEYICIKQIIYFILLRSSLKGFDKLIIDPLLNIYSRTSVVILVVIKENIKINLQNYILNIYIVKDDIRALTTKL